MRAAPLLAAHPPPHVLERLEHVAGGRPLDADRGVAPTAALFLCDPLEPFPADANAAGDASRLIDDEQLAMVARHESEPGAQSGRIEDADVNAALAQIVEKLVRRAARADPIRDDAYLRAARAGAQQGVGEAVADFVRAEDVALERDRVLRVVDQLEHLVERFRSVVQQAHAVPTGDVGGGNTPETARERRSARSRQRRDGVVLGVRGHDGRLYT